MTRPGRNTKLKLQFFRNLPSEVVIDIISRLPVRTIGICKCVCKPWRDLLRTREFADFHLSKSVPGLIVGNFQYPQNYKIMEFVDEIGLESHDLHYNAVAKFDFKRATNSYETKSYELKGSVNGLILLLQVYSRDAYIFNLLTRECIRLPNDGTDYSDSRMVTCVYGVSKMTGQHKVVKIFHMYNDTCDDTCDLDTRTLQNVTRSVCLVYTLGTGSWRSITPPAPFEYDSSSIGASIHGNIHWFVENADGSHCISCFDVETEAFSTFSHPRLVSRRSIVGLVVLGDWLRVCENTVSKIVIWLMKEYGDERSWTKEFVIRKSFDYVCDCIECRQVVSPFKVFKDGDILMAWGNMHMIYYSKKTKTTTWFNVFGLDEYERDEGVSAMLHTYSFLSLGCFPNESVRKC